VIPTVLEKVDNFLWPLASIPKDTFGSFGTYHNLCETSLSQRIDAFHERPLMLTMCNSRTCRANRTPVLL
jgi:hypothetical protein